MLPPELLVTTVGSSSPGSPEDCTTCRALAPGFFFFPLEEGPSSPSPVVTVATAFVGEEARLTRRGALLHTFSWAALATFVPQSSPQLRHSHLPGGACIDAICSLSPSSLLKHLPHRAAGRYADMPTIDPPAPAGVKLDVVAISSQTKPFALAFFTALRIGSRDIRPISFRMAEKGRNHATANLRVATIFWDLTNPSNPSSSWEVVGFIDRRGNFPSSAFNDNVIKSFGSSPMNDLP